MLKISTKKLFKNIDIIGTDREEMISRVKKEMMCEDNTYILLRIGKSSVSGQYGNLPNLIDELIAQVRAFQALPL